MLLTAELVVERKNEKTCFSYINVFTFHNVKTLSIAFLRVFSNHCILISFRGEPGSPGPQGESGATGGVGEFKHKKK